MFRFASALVAPNRTTANTKPLADLFICAPLDRGISPVRDGTLAHNNGKSYFGERASVRRCERDPPSASCILIGAPNFGRAAASKTCPEPGVGRGLLRTAKLPVVELPVFMLHRGIISSGWSFELVRPQAVEPFRQARSTTATPTCPTAFPIRDQAGGS